MTTIKIIAHHREHLAQLEDYLKAIIKRIGADARVEGNLISGDLLMSHGVWAKDFPVVTINDHAVWQATLPPEDIVTSWLKWPSSVSEAVDRILSDVPENDLKAILSDPMRESMLAQGIRNGFGLWTGNAPLRRSCGGEGIEPDEASRIIIEALKARCAHREPLSPFREDYKLNSEVAQKLRDRAENAATSYRILFDAFGRTRAITHPQVMLLPNWESFTGMAVLAGCFSLSVCLAHEAPAELRTELEMIMRRRIELRYPGSEAFWEDLARFSSEGLLRISRQERGEYIFLLAALWLTEHLSDSQDFEGKETLCAEVALILQNESIGYWSGVQDYSKN